MWFVIFIMGLFAALLIWGCYFPAEGRTSGIVEEVKVEIDERHGRKGHKTDPRSYRVYVRYFWDGQEHIGKSFSAYGTAKYFPGDRVNILVHKKQKGIVKIAG